METLANNLGGFAFIALLVYTIYDRYFSKRAKEHTKADEKLADIFKSTIVALETKINHLSDELDKTNEELHKIKSDYDVVVKILQGRDDSFISYQKRGLKVMDKIENNVIPLLEKIDKNTSS